MRLEAIAQQPVYLDPAKPLDDRVDDLLRQLTLAEKISLLGTTAPAIERLKIPAMNGWNQSLHGIVWTEPTTMFPVPISMAATWNPALVHDVAAAIADEGRAINNYWPTVQGKVEPTGGQGQNVTVTADGKRLRHNGLVYRSPVINISRDPRWGRIWEAFGEDTWLTSRMTVAYVKGTQGDDPKYLKLAATLKHYAVNNEERDRTKIDVTVSERMLREYFLPHFKAGIVEGKASSIMSSYNSINGTPGAENEFLLKTLLRDEWKFEGFIVPDSGAVERLVTGSSQVRDVRRGGGEDGAGWQRSRQLGLCPLSAGRGRKGPADRTPDRSGASPCAQGQIPARRIRSARRWCRTRSSGRRRSTRRRTGSWRCARRVNRSCCSESRQLPAARRDKDQDDRGHRAVCRLRADRSRITPACIRRSSSRWMASGSAWAPAPEGALRTRQRHPRKRQSGSQLYRGRPRREAGGCLRAVRRHQRDPRARRHRPELHQPAAGADAADSPRARGEPSHRDRAPEWRPGVACRWSEARAAPSGPTRRPFSTCSGPARKEEPRSPTCCSATTILAAGCRTRSTQSVQDIPPMKEYDITKGFTYMYFDGEWTGFSAMA